MNTVVVPIGQGRSSTSNKLKRTTRIERLTPDEGEVVWSVEDIPTVEAARLWIDRHIEGKGYEHWMRGLWAAEPRVRQQADKLISFITPKWPAPNGQPLMGVALDAAGKNLETVVDEGFEYKPRLVGAFLRGLMSVHPNVARLNVRGLDRAGHVQHWNHFSSSILDWARDCGMKEVLASDCADRSAVWQHGLHTVMLAAIAHPTEIGFMERYAPQF